MMRFPENPFRPGAGRSPAHRGRRPEVESVLSDILRSLRSGRADTELAFLYGPRGTGKTVLLLWLEAEAERRTGGRQIVQARISITDMSSPSSVAQTILNAAAGPADRVSLTIEGSAGVPGLGSVRVAGTGRPRPLSLAEALSERTEPLLLTLDEAHEALPKMLGGLLNVVQEAGRRRPIAAVLAGTPGLERTLLEAHASFWSRGEKLRIGLLPEESAREVLSRPFRDAGLEADDEAIAALASAADNYPYFLQLYGRAAWRVVEASGGRALRAEHVTETLAAADGARRDYYLDRYREFSHAGLLPLARLVADAFVASADTPAERRLPDMALDRILTRHGSAVDSKAFLIAKGYVWQEAVGDPSWSPGIPSLMDYMTENIPAE